MSIRNLKCILWTATIINLLAISCEKEELQELAKKYIEKNIVADNGGILKLDSIQLEIPSNALANDGIVFLGVTGEEPDQVPNPDIEIVVSPITIKIPCDTLIKPLKISFPARNLDKEEVIMCLFDGQTFLPVQFEIKNELISLEISNIEINDYYYKKSLVPNVSLGDIIILGLQWWQTPQENTIGLHEVTISSGSMKLEEPAANSTSKVLLLVHGWGGRISTWDSLITWYNKEHVSIHTDIWTYGYISSNSITEIGKDLGEDIKKYANGAQIDIVAHSMGGLVSRSMLEDNTYYTNINSLITIGTPHKGSPLGAFYALLGSIVMLTDPSDYENFNINSQAFKDLYTGSDFIEKRQDVQTSPIPYYLIAAKNIPVMFDPIAGKNKYVPSSVLIQGDDDGIVAVSSAFGMPDAVNLPSEAFFIEKFGEVHRGMTRYKPIYNQVISYLIRENNSPPLQPSNPNPGSNSQNVNTTLSLSWTCTDPDNDPLTYDVYFGVSNPLSKIASSQTSNNISRSGLNNNTTYYWYIVAHDDKGNSTSGPVWQFTTAPNITRPTVSTSSVTTFTQTSATIGGAVTSDGGATVTERGVYWGTSQNPETTGTKKIIGSGTGTFSSSISGLNSVTTYYVKAYAINSAGIAYGTQVSFQTSGYAPVAAFTASATNITAGQSVQFTDQSTNTPTSWSWNFGDGVNSTSKNPSHTYNTAGTYTVTLTVTNNYGSDIETKTGHITVNQVNTIPSSGLVAYYPFNGNANDESGNGNNGIVYGPKLTADRFGNPNSAYNFDAIDDYIEINNSSSLNFNQNITISFWAKLETSGPYYFPYHILEKGDAWGGGQRENDINWGIKTNNGSFNLWSLDFEFNKLYHIVWVYNGTSIITYVNGQLKNSTPATGSILTNTKKLYISRYDLGGDYFFDGTLDDFRIYNRALSNDEILLLYHEGGY